VARFLLALAAFAALVLASCGGDDDERPSRGAGAGASTAARADKLIERAAGPNAKARSGVISGELEITIRGVPEFAEPFTTSLDGPFRYRKGAVLPDYEIDLGARDYGLELSSVNGKSYATIGTTGYELPASVRDRLVRSSSRGANGLMRTLEQFGVVPPRWETDRRVAGNERIDGVDTVHITTSFNAGRMLRDANTLLGLMTSLGITRAVGLPSQIPARTRRRFVRGVTTKVGESWVGAADGVLRQSGFTMRFSIPKADRSRLGGISGGMVVGRLKVTEVGRPQKITAPASLGSFSDFQAALAAVGDARDDGR
jgi:hypothetical protein